MADVNPVVEPPLPSLTALRDRYVANLTALYASDAALAMRIENVPFGACPALECTPDGAYTGTVRSDSGETLYIHSRRRPLDEARQTVASQLDAPLAEAGGEAPAAAPQAAAPTGTDDPTARCAACVIFGSGLGHHLRAAADHAAKPVLILVEPDVSLLKAAMCVTDMSDLLRRHRLVILTDSDRFVVQDRLRSMSTWLMLGTRLVSLPYTQRVQPGFHAQVRAALTDLISYLRTQYVTLLKNAQTTFRNVLFNLPTYVSCPGVDWLAARAASFPAIVIGAGPSLAQHLPLLRELQGRAVLIAVQTVLAPLHRVGITPHFVTSLDYHEISASYFQELREPTSAILVAEPKVAWQVPEAFTGRTHLLHSRIADELLRDKAPRREALRAGSTVAHLAFYLAEHLACDPIILVGLDLAFSDGMYYAPGMPVESAWGPELSRFQTLEMKQWERITRVRPILRKVPSLAGPELYTDDPMFAYSQQFAADFTQSQARVLLAGPSGSRLTGAEPMPLSTAAEQFCRRPLPVNLFDVAHALGPRLAPADARAELSSRLQEIRQVHRIAQEMQRLLNELTQQLERPGEFNRSITRVDSLRIQMLNLDRAYRLVTSVSQAAELRRIQADRMLGEDDSPADDIDTARKRLRRDREFVKQFLEGCEFLLRVIPEGEARLREGQP